MSTLSTHVLDAVSGDPAAGIAVRLDRRDDGGDWAALATATTDTDGRVRDFGSGALGAGDHRLVFDTGGYFAATGQAGFYPEVTVAFSVAGDRHYHVPLLLSPFAYSTYRGS